ncbi:MAG: hypothetical protein ACJ76G_07400, partial [Solirubrobacterales bacterium]
QLEVGGEMRRIAVLVALAGATMLLAAGTAGASSYNTTGPTDASAGASPFAPGCGGTGEGFHSPDELAGVNFPNTEIEPWF